MAPDASGCNWNPDGGRASVEADGGPWSQSGSGDGDEGKRTSWIGRPLGEDPPGPGLGGGGSGTGTVAAGRDGAVEGGADDGVQVGHCGPWTVAGGAVGAENGVGHCAQGGGAAAGAGSAG